MIIYKVTKNSLPNEDPLIKIFKGKKETLKNKTHKISYLQSLQGNPVSIPLFMSY